MKQVNSIGNNARIHRAVSADGTEIAGRVHGQGAPLVLVTGGPGDGETSWRSLGPFLSEQFTCYCMSTRGKGLSADHSDHSVGRRVQDITAFVDSIGKPVRLTGHSSGGPALEAGSSADRRWPFTSLLPANSHGFSRRQYSPLRGNSMLDRRDNGTTRSLWTSPATAPSVALRKA
jgi:hypothetical protein